MADGEINRNGATIRIDDDGGVQVEPAEGQEVEYTGPDRGTDAIRDSVNTERASISNVAADLSLGDSQEIDEGSFAQLELNDIKTEHSDVLVADPSNNKIVVQQSGTFAISARCRFLSLESGDDVRVRINVNGASIDRLDDERQDLDGDKERFQLLFPKVESDLSSGDEITMEARFENGTEGTRLVQSDHTFLSVGRSG